MIIPIFLLSLAIVSRLRFSSEVRNRMFRSLAVTRHRAVVRSMAMVGRSSAHMAVLGSIGFDGLSFKFGSEDSETGWLTLQY